MKILYFFTCLIILADLPAQTAQALTLSATDRDAIARITYAEAAGQGDTGLAAVVHVILNRLASGKFGKTTTEIINAKNQFEPATRAGGWQYLPALNPQLRSKIDTIINLILDGRLPDPTNGSLYFQNPAVVSRREAEGKASKGLTRFNGSSPAAVIRDHEFYSSIRSGKNTQINLPKIKSRPVQSWDIYGQSAANTTWDVFTR
ncbi:MAG: cell wall hydrolase [Geobacteraceae bacterium]|nr:cell wall hydrolase [Geobacteraceae bacterium]